MAADLDDNDRIASTSTAASEQIPFLGPLDGWEGEGGLGTRHNKADSNSDDDGSSALGHAAGLALEPQSLYRQNVVFLSFCIVFLLSMAYGINLPPVTAVMEAIICRQYYPDAAFAVGRRSLMVTEDPVCKGFDVQGDLASLRGWLAMLEGIPSILLTLPFGILSDRWGRKPVLGLSMLGMLLQFIYTPIVLTLPDIFPLWTVLLSPLFLFIGGGWTVWRAMIFTVLADAVPLANRPTVFFHINAVVLLSDMISGPLAGGLMAAVGPRLPLVASIVMVFTATILVAFLPETLGVQGRSRRLRHRRRGESMEEEVVFEGATGRGEEEIDELTGDLASPPLKKATLPDVQSLPGPDTPPDRGSVHSARTKHAVGLGAALLEAWEFVLHNRRISVLTLSLVFVVLGWQAQDILLQYTTKRYGWTWSRAALLLGIRGAATLALIVAGLPLLSWWCISRRGMPAVRKDLWLARWSGLALVAGALLIASAADGVALSAGLIVLSGGGGLPSLIRSLTNGLVEEYHVGTLNSLLGLMETVGMLVAGPALSQSLRVGMEMGGAWVGLPFLAAAAMFAASTAILWTVRLPGERGQRHGHAEAGAGSEAGDEGEEEEEEEAEYGEDDEQDEVTKPV